MSGRLEIKRVWEDGRVLAFHHPHPTSEIHVVVIPKRHIMSILEPEAADGELLTSMVKAIQFVAVALCLDQDGFYVRTNAGTDGVTPHMHWHIHGPGIP